MLFRYMSASFFIMIHKRKDNIMPLIVINLDCQYSSAVLHNKVILTRQWVAVVAKKQYIFPQQHISFFLKLTWLQYYDIPRQENPGHVGHTEFPKIEAQRIINAAPAPTHNKERGRRPHAHFDREDLFIQERTPLTPLPGVQVRPDRPAPVLWAYPANNFDYATQNRRGAPPAGVPGGRGRDHREPFRGGGVDAGPFRIVTDRHQNIQGMVYHPVDDEEGFERAPERQRRQRRHH